MPAYGRSNEPQRNDNQPMRIAPILAVDFFCGAGGMTHGLIKAGLHVLAGVDNEPLCERTYRQNRNRDGTSPEFICKDIFPRSRNYPHGQRREVCDILRSLIVDFRRRTGIRTYKLVFAICAPCQPFTKITKIEISEGRRFKRDNDANLLLTMMSLIREFRPDAVICENVEGIASAESDSVINRFKRRLRYAGYAFDAKVVNAARFGVPQNRRRTIGLGLDMKKYGDSVSVLDADPKVKRYVTVAETIGHLPPLAAGEVHPSLPNHRARSLNDLNLKRISCAKPGEPNLYLRNTPYGDLSLACHQRLEEKWGGRSFSDTYTRMRSNEVGPTITTKCISITNGRFGHYDTSQNRGITPREAALLQTFPRNYIFYPQDNIHFTATLIGNAVPPKLARFFGKCIAVRLAVS